jgi:hypothetical protein
MKQRYSQYGNGENKRDNQQIEGIYSEIEGKNQYTMVEIISKVFRPMLQGMKLCVYLQQSLTEQRYEKFTGFLLQP